MTQSTNSIDCCLFTVSLSVLTSQFNILQIYLGVLGHSYEIRDKTMTNRLGTYHGINSTHCDLGQLRVSFYHKLPIKILMPINYSWSKDPSFHFEGRRLKWHSYRMWISNTVFYLWNGYVVSGLIMVADIQVIFKHRFNVTKEGFVTSLMP